MEMNKLLEIENLKRENLIKEINKNFLVESGAGAGNKAPVHHDPFRGRIRVVDLI